MITSQKTIDFLKFEGYVPLTYPYVLPMQEEEFACARALLAKDDNVLWAEVWHADNEVELWTIPLHDVKPEEKE